MRKATKISTTATATRTTRRAILGGIAATAAIPPTAAATVSNLQGATDPAFSLISAAAKTRKAIEDDCGADHAIHCRLVAADWAAVDKIVAHEPRTLAGAAASLRFFESRMDVDALREQERMQAAFATLATALERIDAGRLS